MRQFLMSGSRWRGVETEPPRSPRHSSTLPMRRERKRCGRTRRQQLGSHRRRWTELPVVLADSRARRPLTLLHIITPFEGTSHPASQRGYRDRRDHQESIVTVPTILNRRLRAWCPGAAYHGLEHKAAFVVKDDAPPIPTGLFLILGQRSLRQRWMASSSLSRARRSGFWALQPISRKMRQTWPG